MIRNWNYLMGWLKLNQSTCKSERTPKKGWKYLVRLKCGKNSCRSNPSKISTTLLWLSRLSWVCHLSPVFSSSARCLLEMLRPFPSFPQTALKTEDVTQPAEALTLHVPWLIFPSSSVPLDRRSLWKTFKRTLSFSAPSPLYLISFQEPLRA